MMYVSVDPVQMPCSIYVVFNMFIQIDDIQTFLNSYQPIQQR